MRMNAKGMMTAVAMLGSVMLLSACGETNPFARSLPDETQVVDGPTLALPPQFDLRPPREAADYEAVLRSQKAQEAQNLIVTGTSETTAVTPAGDAAAVPAGDDWLLEQSAAQSGVVADPNVRQELATKSPEEVKAAAEAEKKKGLFQRWFGSDSDE